MFVYVCCLQLQLLIRLQHLWPPSCLETTCFTVRAWAAWTQLCTTTTEPAICRRRSSIFQCFWKPFYKTPKPGIQTEASSEHNMITFLAATLRAIYKNITDLNTDIWSLKTAQINWLRCSHTIFSLSFPFLHMSRYRLQMTACIAVWPSASDVSCHSHPS